MGEAEHVKKNSLNVTWCQAFKNHTQTAYKLGDCFKRHNHHKSGIALQSIQNHFLKYFSVDDVFVLFHPA